MKRVLQIAAALAMALPAAAAPAAGPLLGANLTNNGQAVSAPMQIVILLTILTLLPAVVMCITPFLRITVVLHFLCGRRSELSPPPPTR
jgi:flagellar biosynthetic protein FliP